MLLTILATYMLTAASVLKAKPITKGQLDSTRIFGPLTFNSDGTFQISIFEDLHFGESKL